MPWRYIVVNVADGVPPEFQAKEAAEEYAELLMKGGERGPVYIAQVHGFLFASDLSAKDTVALLDKIKNESDA